MTHRALLPSTQEMRERCSALGQQMLHWPGVKMYHVFGTCAFYHRKVMFAMLPGERSLDSSTAISYRGCCKDHTSQDADWHTFELSNGALVNDALASLEKAYRDTMSPPVIEPLVLSTPVDASLSAK
jgi:hypothetical protein